MTYGCETRFLAIGLIVSEPFKVPWNELSSGFSGLEKIYRRTRLIDITHAISKLKLQLQGHIVRGTDDSWRRNIIEWHELNFVTTTRYLDWRPGRGAGHHWLRVAQTVRHKYLAGRRIFPGGRPMAETV
ncbi:hypothetical protein EVAR_43763_1 [Eumeta japonica]|uniref:Uncharacterized protein n=1 Tax=Eumeta variegata TaxID=151549 RepID=A0A4C1XLB6_EUMVA|nr:hypothetical protein EVAR_43763_1 [Eumeta japonica]